MTLTIWIYSGQNDLQYNVNKLTESYALLVTWTYDFNVS